MRSSRPPLLRLARTCVRIPGRFWMSAYAWLSDDELLLSLHVVRDDYMSQYQFYRYNVRTRRRVPLAAVNRQCAEGDRIDAWELSPDRRWLAMRSRGDSWVMHLDGTGYRNAAGGAYHSESYWLGDSRSWITAWHGTNGNLLDYPDLTLHRIGGGPKGTDVPNGATNPLIVSQLHLSTLAARAVGTRLVTVNGDDDGPGRRLVVYSRDLQRPASRSTRTVVPLPHPAQVDHAALSPDGRRIAAALRVAHVGRQDRSGRHSIDDIELWVLPVGRGTARLLGVLAASADAWSENDVEDLDWTPGGRRVSFVCGIALFTVEAGP